MVVYSGQELEEVCSATVTDNSYTATQVMVMLILLLKGYTKK